MCEFKPGDEVVCVDSKPRHHSHTGLVENCVYIVKRVRPARFCSGIVVDVVGVIPPGDGFFPDRFRKVQRRDISQWLETATDYEEPKRKKAKA